MSAAPKTRPKVRVEAIADDDLDAVAQFLHVHMNPRIRVQQWRDSFRTPWRHAGPNHGYALRSGDDLVGVYSAIYSSREIDGREEQFCNLAAWCVQPDQRMHSFALLKKQLAHRDEYHMTDLSPRPEVAKLMRRFGFEDIAPQCWIVPNVPWASRTRVLSGADEIARRLVGSELQAFLDHRSFRTIQHALVEAKDGICHLVFQSTRKRGIPCIVVLHVSDPAVLAGQYAAVGAHLLRRTGIPFTIYEARALTTRPRLAKSFDLGAKLFRSTTLRAEQIDNLYSELVTLPLA